jgi:hypothetical protein
LLFEVSTNRTVPVGTPAPGATGATTALRTNWPAVTANETAALLEAGKTVKLIELTEEGHVASPL